MLNFAHRGFKGLYPENTMLAFRKAVEIGADGIEFDLHLTKDGQLVIIHDEFLDRTTDFRGLVKDYRLRELKKSDASALFDQYDEKIPSLEEYLSYIRDKDIITNIEIKNSIIDYPNIEEKMYEMVKAYDLLDKIIVSSFNHESLLKVKAIDKNVKCGILESSRMVKPWDYVKSLGCEYYHPMNFVVDEYIIQKFKENNIGLNIWFGQSEFDYSRYIIDGVTSLITDYPDRVLDLIEK